MYYRVVFIPDYLASDSTLAHSETYRLTQTPAPTEGAVQTPARVNVTCVTPLGEEVASTR